MIKLLTAFLLLGNITQAQVNLNLGLRAYYPFTGNAADVSGNNNHPVFNNALSVPDRFGNPNAAYAFNGTSSYMRILNSSSLNTTNQLTLTAWVKVAGFYQGLCHDNAILQKGDVDNLTGNYLLRISDNVYTNFQNCSIALPDENHEMFIGHTTVLPTTNPVHYAEKNRWYSLVYTYDGSRARIYVNCELTVQSNVNSLTFTNGYDLYLGKMNHAQYPYWFNGTLDEVRIYDRVLNMDEIKAIGDCLTGTPDLTSSQLFSTTQVAPGGFVDEVIAIRNVGTAYTNAPVVFNITNYAALTGLTVTPIVTGTDVTIGIDTYRITSGWIFNQATGTFTSSNVIPPGGNNNFGLRFQRGTSPNQGANGTVTQTTTITSGTGGGETPGTNNTISNSLLKN